MANVISTSVITAALLAHECTEFCDHVQVNKSLAYVSLNEDDGFGPLSRYVVCKPCYEKAQQEYAEQSTYCDDCKQYKKNSQMRQWRWFDFYAAQGDEPVDICKECWELPKHEKRMSNDRAERQADDDYYNRNNYSDEYDYQD